MFAFCEWIDTVLIRISLLICLSIILFLILLKLVLVDKILFVHSTGCNSKSVYVLLLFLKSENWSPLTNFVVKMVSQQLLFA